jgi:hypothetical protein
MGRSAQFPHRLGKYVEKLILTCALLIAFLSARPYAGGWNDGSRLATVETLVDGHTWRIDDSTYVHVPESSTSLPYDPAEPGLNKYGTLDKLFIDGHYYSDKSPVPALFLAGWYQLWQWGTGWTARNRPDAFCQAMTFLSSGLAYVLAVLCIYRLGRPLRLPLPLRIVLTASFALATVAARYVEQVNNHILLLGVTAALVLKLAWLVEETREGQRIWRRFAEVGTLAGLAYGIDLGVGPVLFLCTFILILSCSLRHRLGDVLRAASPRLLVSVSPCLVFSLAALPWLGLHHALNYSIGGTLAPANANPEYFRWPGSPFDAHNLTGSWIHDGLGTFLLYATSMIAGKRGFFGHNLPLFLTIPAFAILLRRHRENRREVLWAGGCYVGTWLLYAATSNNSSGQCCSIRWFVPLLAPTYYVLALFLQRYPLFRVDFLILSGWGLLLVLLMREGPWMKHVVPYFWLIQAAALCSCVFHHHLRRLSTREPLPSIAVTWDRVETNWRKGFLQSQRLKSSPIAAPIKMTDPPNPISSTARVNREVRSFP